MRQRRASRVSFLVLAGVAVVAVGILIYKAGTDADHKSQLAADTAPTPSAGDGQIAQLPPTVELVKGGATKPDVKPDAKPVTMVETKFTAPGALTTPAPATMPTNIPTTLPSGRASAVPPRAAPSGDAETIFKDATAKRDAGDLVTARDLVSDALQAGRFNDSDTEAAKSFVGQLNDKIIFGTQKFAADGYNDQWKVEPGTVLSKLAKRYDVTAELLCKVNGLSAPNKLKAGSTIKTIKGPFHIVVSKSKFEADIYLGAPGGPNAMYIKTVRVGLGSDGSTPTGTWQVETGKVMNPVYYSSRGQGVIAADDPKNPLGERWIPLKGIEGKCVGQESYGIHGTIDPDSIGKNMSMGCIRLASDDINLLYDLLIENKSLVKVVD